MIGAILGFTGLDAVFVFCGIAGGLLFIIRTILMFTGGADADGDMGGDEGLGDDSDASFQVLTVQGSIVFFMMSLLCPN